MKRGMVLIFLVSILLIAPLVQAETYSGFEKFTDNIKLFFSSGDNKVRLALEIRERAVDSAIENIKFGKKDVAIKDMNNACSKLEIIESKTSPDIAEEVKENIKRIKEKIIEVKDMDLEFFEDYLMKEEKTELYLDRSEKVFDYCEELAKQDYSLMLEDEKCQGDVPDWLEGKVDDKIKEAQEKDTEEIKKQIKISANDPKGVSCDGISLTSERIKCEKYVSLAIRCEFQDDESACKEIDIVEDVQNDEREDFENEILEKYVPAECSEAGIIDGEECKKLIIALHKPDSGCMENGVVLGPEACEQKLIIEDKIPEECIKNGRVVSSQECTTILKTKSKPSDQEGVVLTDDCVSNGYNTKESCGVFTLNQNLPQECVEAGALTPEACEKLKLPQKCQEEAFSNEECEAVFIKEKMPPECQESGTYNFHKCAKLLYARVSSTSIEGEVEYLQNKGITFEEIPNTCLGGSDFVRTMECDEALIKKFGIMLPPPSDDSTIPLECMKGGTPVSPEECEEILQGGIVQDVIPQACIDAEVESPEECGELLEKLRKSQGIGLNMPKECIGVSVEECKLIMGELGLNVISVIEPDPLISSDCIDLGIADEPSCDMVMSKINSQRIIDGDKVIIDDDGDTTYITNDQINKIIDDVDKNLNNVKANVEIANQIKNQIDDIENEIQVIDNAIMDVETPGMEISDNVIDNGGGGSGVIDDDVLPGPQGIVGYQGEGDDNGDGNGNVVDNTVDDGNDGGGNNVVETNGGDSDSGDGDLITGELIKDIKIQNNVIQIVFNFFSNIF
ncbi:hypothetical protein K8R33_01200 [archaeon]|nr:hypothetical protein [archaeon]